MAGIQPWEDLKDHVGTLVAIISILALGIIGLIKGWWTDTSGKFSKLEKATADQFTDVWGEVNRLKQNQVDLRTNLPKEYITKDTWIEIQHERLATLTRIEHKLDGFIESCRKGQCARGGDRDQ